MSSKRYACSDKPQRSLPVQKRPYQPRYLSKLSRFAIPTKPKIMILFPKKRTEITNYVLELSPGSCQPQRRSKRSAALFWQTSSINASLPSFPVFSSRQPPKGCITWMYRASSWQNIAKNISRQTIFVKYFFTFPPCHVAFRE